MLLELRISNLALAVEVGLVLEPGLTMVTGETGAGKSLIAGSLALLGGATADREQIREGEDLAVVEGVLDLSDRPDLAKECSRLGVRLADDGILVVRRELRRTGRNRVLINGLLSSQAVLERIGPRLIAVQSQDQQRELDTPGYARDLLDDLLGLAPKRMAVAEALASFREAEADLARRQGEAAAAAEQLDMWKYQHEELKAAHLVETEEAELSEQLALKQHAQALQTAAARALSRLTEGPAPAREDLGAAQSALEPHVDKSPRLARALEHLAAAGELTADAAGELRRFLDHLDLDPRGLDELQARKALYEDLRRKYNRDVRGLLELQTTLADRLERRAHESRDLAALEARREETAGALGEFAATLRRARREGARTVAVAAEAMIRPLALPSLDLEFSVEPWEDPDGAAVLKGRRCRVENHGADRVSLLVRTNPGESRGPVERIASGGERSRIHLGLTVLRQDEAGQPPVVRLHDEIDAGLGMDAAPPVAELLARLAERGQVLCVTHLATMAAAGTRHVRVTKAVRDGRTRLDVAPLTGSSRLDEIARLLGNEGDPEARRAYAKQLLAASGAA